MVLQTTPLPLGYGATGVKLTKKSNFVQRCRNDTSMDFISEIIYY
jgi:hypothetical protein